MPTKPPPIDVVSASAFSLDALTDLFNGGFAGYLFPVQASVESLAQRIRTEDVDLHASKVALTEGRPAGFGLVARRGCRSRLAAMGVVPEARRQGVAKRLLEAILAEARSRHVAGDHGMRLEVFETNNAARRLYEEAGFRVARRLVGRTLRKPIPKIAALDLSDTPAWNHIPAIASLGLPWQLEAETLAVLGAPARVASLGNKAWAMIYGLSEDMLTLRGLYVEPSHRRQGLGSQLVSALAALHPDRAIHFPPLLPEAVAAGFFQRLGFEVDDMNQVEMDLSF